MKRFKLLLTVFILAIIIGCEMQTDDTRPNTTAM